MGATQQLPYSFSPLPKQKYKQEYFGYITARSLGGSGRFDLNRRQRP